MTAKYLNFSKVAETMFLSQSSVSKYISALEGELGKKLLIRDTKSVTLTEFGEAFLPYAQSMLDAEDTAIEFLHCYKGTQTECTLKLGVAEELLVSPPQSMLAQVVSAVNILRSETDIRVKLRFYSGSEIRDRLADHRLDLGLLPISTMQMGERTYGSTKSVQIDQSSNWLLYPPHHGKCASLEELVPKIDVIIFAHDPVPQSITMEFLHRTKIDPRLRPCENWSEMFVQILEGGGFGIIPDTLLDLADQCGIPYLPLEPFGIESSLYVVWQPESAALEPTIIRFSEILAQGFSQKNKK